MKFINSNLKYQSQLVLSTAMIYYHKYNLITTNDFSVKYKYPNNIYFCSAALFIACKSTNRLLSVNNFIPIAQKLIKKKNTALTKEQQVSEMIGDIKENIFNYEFEILSTINFDTNVDLPYLFFHKVKNYFDKCFDVYSKKLTLLCNYYINDTFLIPISLYFHPNVICLCCAMIVCKKSNLNFDLDCLIKESNVNISIDVIEECEKCIEVIFDKKNNK